MPERFRLNRCELREVTILTVCLVIRSYRVTIDPVFGLVLGLGHGP